MTAFLFVCLWSICSFFLTVKLSSIIWDSFLAFDRRNHWFRDSTQVCPFVCLPVCLFAVSKSVSLTVLLIFQEGGIWDPYSVLERMNHIANPHWLHCRNIGPIPQTLILLPNPRLPWPNIYLIAQTFVTFPKALLQCPIIGRITLILVSLPKP